MTQRPGLRLEDALTLSRVGFAAALWLTLRRPLAMLGVTAAAAATDLLDGWVARRAQHRRAMRTQALAPARRPSPGDGPHLLQQVSTVPIVGVAEADAEADSESLARARVGEIAVAMEGGIDHGHGVWLDPLCDKVFMTSLLAALWVARRPPVHRLLLIGTRELLLVPMVGLYELMPDLRQAQRLNWRAANIGKLTTAAQYAATAALILRMPIAPPLAFAAGATGLMAGWYYLRRAPAAGPTRRA